MDHFLIVLGIWLAGHALRTFASPWLRKLGALTYLSATFFAGYFISGGSQVAGWAAVTGWFLLPWLEIILRVRTMRLPLNKTLTNRFPPSRDEFPHLRELTAEVEEAGFEMLEDTGWDGGEVRQFLRLFYLPSRRVQASLILNQQRGAGIVYFSLTTRSVDGQMWTTTDYPFSSTMKHPPGSHVRRVGWAGSIGALLAIHEAWLEKSGIRPEDTVDIDAATLTERLSGELQTQIRHNLRTGIITESGEGTFRYSWRGCFYLWRQFVKDLVKLA